MADVVDVEGKEIPIVSSPEKKNTLEGHLKKQGKFSTKWYHCFAKLEKDCFVYKRHDKVKITGIHIFSVQVSST